MLDWKKLILYPAAVWAVVYLVICILVGYKVNTGAMWVTLPIMVLGIIGLIIIARAADIKDFGKALVLGLVWVAVMFALDLVLTVPFTGSVYFSSWTTYTNYGLALLMPVIVSKFK